jgi:hypothetical protein
MACWIRGGSSARLAHPTAVFSRSAVSALWAIVVAGSTRSQRRLVAERRESAHLTTMARLCGHPLREATP